MSEYNGWTNYATWRINLEIFDGRTPHDVVGTNALSVYELANALREETHELIECQSTEGLARDYAMAFLNEVDWEEIARNMLSDVEEEENLDIDLDGGLSAVNEQGETK